VRGALLGLDVALARLALRRLETDVPPSPMLTAADRAAFAEGEALPLEDRGVVARKLLRRETIGRDLDLAQGFEEFFRDHGSS